MSAIVILCFILASAFCALGAVANPLTALAWIFGLCAICAASSRK